MKRIIALLIGSLLLLSLAACGKAEPSTNAAETGGGQAETVELGGAPDTQSTAKSAEPTPGPIELPEPEPIPERYDTITLEHLYDLPLDLTGCHIRGMLGNNIIYERWNDWDGKYSVEVQNNWGYTGGSVDGLLYLAKSKEQDGKNMVTPQNMISLDGRAKLEGYGGFKLLSESYGLIAYMTVKDDINRWGIMDLEGNILLEDVAARIAPAGDRFCTVFSSAVPMADQAQALFFQGDSDLSTVPDGPGYTGEYRLYDYEKRDFVPGITLGNTGSGTLQGAADNLFALASGGMTTFYDASGNVFREQKYQSVNVLDEYIMMMSNFSGAEDYMILYMYDKDLNLLDKIDMYSDDYASYGGGRYIVFFDYDYAKVQGFVLNRIYDVKTKQTVYTEPLVTTHGRYDIYYIKKLDAFAIDTTDGALALYRASDFSKLMDLAGDDAEAVQAYNGFISDGNTVYGRDGKAIGLCASKYDPYRLALGDEFGAALLTQKALTDTGDRVWSETIAPFIYMLQINGADWLLVESLTGERLLGDRSYTEMAGNDAFIAAYAEDSGLLEVYRIVRS